MNKNKIVPVVRWTPVGEDPIQCLNDDAIGSYDTYCGTDIDDPGYTNEAGTKAIYKQGRVTCQK